MRVREVLGGWMQDGGGSEEEKNGYADNKLPAVRGVRLSRSLSLTPPVSRLRLNAPIELCR